MRTSLHLLAIGTLLLTQAPASAALLRQKQIGNWQAGAYSFDDSGKFSHCAASARYRNGVALLFTINNKYQWGVGLVSEGWRLDKGARYPVSLRVDDGRLVEETAVAVLPNFVKVQLADSAALFNAMKYGGLLKIFAAGQTFTFQLTDTSAVLPQLLACVKSYEVAPPQTTANPFVAAPTQTAANPFLTVPPKPADAPATPAAAPDAAERRAEATSLVANILGRAGVGGFEILSPEQSKDFVGDVVWKNSDAFGTIQIVANEAAKPEDINATLLASDSKACHDKFLSGSKPDTSGARLFTSCVSDKQTLTIYYSTLKRPKGGYYILATGGFDRVSRGAKHPAEKKPTQDMDTGIRTAAFTVLAH